MQVFFDLKGAICRSAVYNNLIDGLPLILQEYSLHSPCSVVTRQSQPMDPALSGRFASGLPWTAGCAGFKCHLLWWMTFFELVYKEFNKSSWALIRF